MAAGNQQQYSCRSVDGHFVAPTSISPYLWRAIYMDNTHRQPDPDNHDIWAGRQRFKTLRHDPLQLQLEDVLKQLNMWEDPVVQQQMWLVRCGTDKSRTRALSTIISIIQDYESRAVAYQDRFMPYATAEQISNNGQGIHILDQANNHIPFYASEYSYCLLWLVLGPQGGGKSSAVFHQLKQIHVPVQILDHKGNWEFRAEQLNYKVIPAEYVRFDLDIEEDKLPLYLHSVLEGVACGTGLQFGLSCLFEAGDIALAQRKRFIEQTGEKTPLCLKDIHLALSLCEVKDLKRRQYLESARTALELLLGRNNLFSTRSGLPLDQFFAGNYILQCRHLTTTQSRFLAWFLLNYLYFKSLHAPETTKLKSLLVFEDCSKLISKPDNIFGSGARTSVYLHLLSTLRSTGRGAFFVDQLVEPICDDVKQLCNNWLVVGGMRGTHNQSEVASAMSLSRDQADMLGSLQCREAVCFCPTTYPRAIHGFIPEVEPPISENF
jgi:hypothetical protein